MREQTNAQQRTTAYTQPAAPKKNDMDNKSAPVLIPLVDMTVVHAVAVAEPPPLIVAGGRKAPPPADAVAAVHRQTDACSSCGQVVLWCPCGAPPPAAPAWEAEPVSPKQSPLVAFKDRAAAISAGYKLAIKGGAAKADAYRYAATFADAAAQNGLVGEVVRVPALRTPSQRQRKVYSTRAEAVAAGFSLAKKAGIGPADAARYSQAFANAAQSNCDVASASPPRQDRAPSFMRSVREFFAEQKER